MPANGIAAITINGTTIGGIADDAFARREKILSQGLSGNQHNTLHAVRAAAPHLTFRTKAAGSLLALLNGSTAAPMVKLNGTTGLVAYGGKSNDVGPGYLATGHWRMTALNGQVFLRSLRWSQNGDGVDADLEALFVSTAGGTDPCVEDTVNSLPAIQDDEVFVCTGITFGGTSLNNPVSFDLAVDAKATNDVEGTSHNAGLPYPVAVISAGAMGSIDIMATIETLDLYQAVTGSGTWIATFQKLANGGVLPGSPLQTITVTLTAAVARIDSIGGSQGSPRRRRITVRGLFNGTTQPLGITVV